MGQKDRDLYDYVAERMAAAEKGKAEALYDLGLLYSTGQGVERDYIAAHKWFNLAAERGVNRAKVDREELAHEMSRRDIVKALKQAREWLAVH